MRVKKIRGHKHIWKRIELWKENNADLDIEALKIHQRNYVKLWFHPYGSISNLNSVYPEPKGETRKKILSALYEIYDTWRIKLEELGEPYYLKIWLNEPHLSKSQIVCAIGDFLTFYDSTFQLDQNSKQKIELNQDFKWDRYLDEYHLSSSELGEKEDYYSEEDYLEEKRYLDGQLKKPHRKSMFKDKSGKEVEYYSFKQGYVWLGERRID
tara:strand:- start:9668 stop:10300 length:633 start_codon:yes stop_codon:yes gene_type:complete